MPKYRAVVKVRLREDFKNISAFTKQDAEEYVWSIIGEEGENLEVEFMDWDDLDVTVYEEFSNG